MNSLFDIHDRKFLIHLIAVSLGSSACNFQLTLSIRPHFVVVTPALSICKLH